MTPAPPLVVPIFATPFVVVPLPALAAINPTLVAACDAIAAAEPRAASARCYVGRDDLFERTDAPMRMLGEAMLAGVSTAVSSVNDYPPEQFATFRTEARGWITIVRPDGHVPAANYPMTAWIGIYCIAAPEPSPTRYDSGVLRLYETRLGTMYSDATNALMREPFRTGHHAWTPAPGLLAVFPASALHEVALVRAASPLVLATVRVRYTAPDQTGHSRW